jgi:hypothetical protein
VSRGRRTSIGVRARPREQFALRRPSKPQRDNGSIGLREPGRCVTSERKSSIESSQPTYILFRCRFVLSHITPGCLSAVPCLEQTGFQACLTGCGLTSILSAFVRGLLWKSCSSAATSDGGEGLRRGGRHLRGRLERREAPILPAYSRYNAWARWRDCASAASAAARLASNSAISVSIRKVAITCSADAAALICSSRSCCSSGKQELRRSLLTARSFQISP